MRGCRSRDRGAPLAILPPPREPLDDDSAAIRLTAAAAPATTSRSPAATRRADGHLAGHRESLADGDRDGHPDRLSAARSLARRATWIKRLPSSPRRKARSDGRRHRPVTVAVLRRARPIPSNRGIEAGRRRSRGPRDDPDCGDASSDSSDSAGDVSLRGTRGRSGVEGPCRTSWTASARSPQKSAALGGMTGSSDGAISSGSAASESLGSPRCGSTSAAGRPSGTSSSREASQSRGSGTTLLRWAFAWNCSLCGPSLSTSRRPPQRLGNDDVLRAG